MAVREVRCVFERMDVHALVAQWKSRGLLSPRSQVRILPGAPSLRSPAAEANDSKSLQGRFESDGRDHGRVVKLDITAVFETVIAGSNPALSTMGMIV